MYAQDTLPTQMQAFEIIRSIDLLTIQYVYVQSFLLICPRNSLYVKNKLME